MELEAYDFLCIIIAAAALKLVLGNSPLKRIDLNQRALQKEYVSILLLFLDLSKSVLCLK